MYASTRIQYEPVNITFHDDHADTVNAFWKKYYEYHIADSVSMNSDLQISATKDSLYDSIDTKGDGNRMNKYGLDTPAARGRPYLKGIEIFVLHKKRFTSMTLVNPVIGSFSHDNLDAADGGGVLQNTMNIFYETVIYKAGIINRNNVPGFATVHYDNEPSPLSVLGGGTNSIFGPGGVVDGIGSVIRNVQTGNILGAILGASNTYNNAKKIKKRDVKEELKGIAKEGVLDIGKQAGSITNPVGRFSVGAAVAAGAMAVAAVAPAAWCACVSWRWRLWDGAAAAAAWAVVAAAAWAAVPLAAGSRAGQLRRRRCRARGGRPRRRRPPTPRPSRGGCASSAGFSRCAFLY